MRLRPRLCLSTCFDDFVEMLAKSLKQPRMLYWARIGMKHLAIVTAIVAVFLFFALPNINPGPFTYDEADYMYAAGRGWLANYLDSPSLSFPDYIRMGLSRGRDTEQSAALSRTVRRSGDMFLYRHAHGPVYFYWLSALSMWSVEERMVRTFSLVFPVITALAVYFGCLWILPALQGQLAAILGCILYLWSPAVVRSTEVAPHQMFAMWFIVTLLLLAKLMATGAPKFWYAAVGMTAVAFCTLEVTFVLIAVLVACAYLERRRLALGWRLAGKSAALFAVIVVLLHPATITKLAFAKSYLFFAYLSVQRKAPWGNVTFLETWSRRFETSPVAWILIVVVLFLWVRSRDLGGRREALPFLLFGGLMLATMLRVLTTGLRYVLPFLPAFLVFTGIVLSGALVRLRPAARAIVMVLVCAALLFDAERYRARHPFNPDPHPSLLIALMKERNLAAARLLVPHDDLPTLHYYFPAAELTAYLEEASVPAGQFDAIVRTGDPIRIDLVTR
jgi:hypothetical protein